MAFYTDSNGNVVSDESKYVQPEKAKKTGSVPLAKIFGYMFAGLLITALVAFGAGAIFANWLVTDPETASEAMFMILIVAAIVTIVLSIVMMFSLRKNSTKAILVPAIIYTICMGILLSSFTIFVDWWLLAGAFGITSLVFGLMALIAFTAKGNLSGLWIVAIGLIIGCGIISLVNLVLSLVLPSFPSLYWLVSLGLFAAVMFITMFDMWRIKQICDQGAMSNNLALYCAFTLYVDFIYIFIRILAVLSKLKNN